MRMTVAIVDVGSNTVRLLVARRSVRGLEPVHRERVRLGLGQEIERQGRISDVKLAAAAKAVSKLTSLARKHGADAIDVLVTAPGRQSANADELVAALERAARRPVRVLSAEEEGRLAFAGAVATAKPEAPLVAVCDLGGASTEVAVGRPEAGPSWVRSVDLGALRLTTRLQDGERPPAAVVRSGRELVREAFAGFVPPLPHEALAVGGSARGLRKLVGPALGAEQLEGALEILMSRTHANVARRYGVDRRRVPLLPAAALILAEVQRRLAVPLLVVDGGLREGAILESLGERAA